MKITFDPQKDLLNREKHGVSLALAEHIVWSTLLEYQDAELFYGEERFIGFAFIGVDLHCAVYTDRGDTRRIISLRKATKPEVNHYANS